MNQRTVSIESLGCKLNVADSEAIARRFVQAGCRIASPGATPDIRVVNTCTVTGMADRKGRQALARAARDTHAVVVATGCYVQRAPDEVRRLPGVDLVIDNQDKGLLVQEVMTFLGPPPNGGIGDPRMGLAPEVGRTRAFVKIQEGCNQVCAYCIVPRVRGRERSILMYDVVRQVQEHVAEGYKEVVLTGTQLGSYGREIPGASLQRLLERLLSETTVARLRVSSLQAQEVDSQLLDLWSDERLCPHFHIPLQSGSADVLERMRRRYTSTEYVEAVERVRRQVPNASLTTDVLVGFPGETEDDFEATYSLCKGMAFAGMHVFPYSVRPGTSAALMAGRVDPATVRSRAARLRDLAGRLAREHRGRLIGSMRWVLWELGGHSELENNLWAGLTEDYVPVKTRSSPVLGNRITRVRLVSDGGDALWAVEE